MAERAYHQLKWIDLMENQEKTWTSNATIVALPERTEYNSLIIIFLKSMFICSLNIYFF